MKSVFKLIFFKCSEQLEQNILSNILQMQFQKNYMLNMKKKSKRLVDIFKILIFKTRKTERLLKISFKIKDYVKTKSLQSISLSSEQLSELVNIEL
jgi:hypothetical protein